MKGRTGKNLFALGTGILLLGGFQAPSPDKKPKAPAQKEVWVVLSGDAGPYRKAAQALEKALEKEDVHTKEILLKELEEADFQAQKRPSACVAVGTKAALHLHQVLPPEILFSFCLVTHPEALGILEGRPFLGVTTDIPLSTQVALARKALPWIRRVGLLFSGKNKTSLSLKKELRARIPKEWTLQAVDVKTFASRAEAIETLLSGRPDLVWTFPDPSVFDLASLRALLLGALRKKIPVFGFSAPLVRSGALLGPFLDPASQGDLLGKKLLSKLKDGDGPKLKKSLFFPETLYAVNLNVAARLGIQLPPELVKKAKIVFGSKKEEEER